MDGAVLYRIYDLPWSTAVEQEERFRRLLKITLAGVLLASLLIALLPVADRDARQVEEVPPRFARMLTERETPPPPPPVAREEPEPEPEPEPIPVPEPEPVVVEERSVEPEPLPAPEPEPVDRTEQARERAQRAGLLPFAEQLASLRDAAAAQRLDQAELTGAAEAGSTITERSLITSRAGTASAGINTAALSRDTGGGGLAARATTQVESPVGGGAASGAGVENAGGASNRAGRSREEIEQVFDRNKSAIYALYNRALRQNPSLEGRLVLRLTIAPSGEVTDCQVVSSELGDPELEQRLVQRVMLFRFEPKDVEAITTTKPIEFFPA